MARAKNVKIYVSLLVSLAIAVLLNILTALDTDYGFSIGRTLVWFFAALLTCFFAIAVRPSSVIWEKKFDADKRSHLFMVFVATTLVSVAMIPLSQISHQQEWLENPYFDNSLQHVQDGNQYDYLADALIEGNVALDLPVSDILPSMDNPYDPMGRYNLNLDKHDPIFWDYAYYDGSYYCYFGVLPCLLTFVPFKLLFGCDLRTDFAVVFFAICLAYAIPFFLRALIKAFAYKPSVGVYFLALCSLWICSDIIEQVFLPRIYSIPILSALFFTFLGLGFWLVSKNHVGHLGFDAVGIACLVLGGLCIGATLACRPQFILCALLAFPIFGREIKNRLFFSRKGALNTIAVIIPFVIIAIPVCCYNFVRFGSLFDFGASYNLTGADMTSYTFSFKVMCARVAEYLFLPPSFISEFPFFCTINETQPPSFLYTNESFYAGLFPLFPYLLVGFFAVFPICRKRLKRNGTLLLSIFSVLLAFVIMGFDSIASGVTMRYFSDFAWLLCIASCLVVFSNCCADDKGKSGGWIPSLLTYTIFFSVIFYSATLFGNMRIGSLLYSNPDLYYLVMRLFIQ